MYYDLVPTGESQLNLVAVLCHESQDIPNVIQLSDFSKFLKLCESLPTTWAYLYNKYSEK